MPDDNLSLLQDLKRRLQDDLALADQLNLPLVAAYIAHAIENVDTDI